MNPGSDPELALAAGTLDALDVRLLDDLRAVHTALDPVPADLTDRIKFAMSVAALEAQVAELVSSATLETVRATDYDRAHTVTFTADDLSVMVSIEYGTSTRVDVVGWVNQPEVEVELRERGRTRSTTVDEDGRFAFAGVERGLVSFVLRRQGQPSAPPIITPATEL
jgi:hypothetical protein